MRPSEAPKIPLAAEARPLGEDGQSQDLRVGEQGRQTGFRRLRSVIELPLVVHEHVQ